MIRWEVLSILNLAMIMSRWIGMHGWVGPHSLHAESPPINHNHCQKVKRHFGWGVIGTEGSQFEEGQLWKCRENSSYVRMSTSHFGGRWPTQVQLWF